MTTTTQVTTQPASGLVHIDALLGNNQPGWMWLTPTRTTLTYTFSLAGGNAADIGSILNAAPVAFNAAQQNAAVQALQRITDITGIVFVATSDGAAADLHFAAADIIGASTSGITSSKRSWSTSGNTVVSYTADSYVYLDNVQWNGSNASPTPGGVGFETLLHELGHAMGLKHPFEDGVTLSAADDNTTNTLMSYTESGGPYSDFRPFDIAALLFLYGDDGLGGTLGVQGSGRYLMGRSGADTLSGTGGDDVLEGSGGNDSLSGGGGTDTAVYSGNRASYTITIGVGSVTISGPDGTDTLSSVENARFADQTVALVGGGGGGNQPPTGGVAVSGTAQQGATLTVTSTLADPDGLGPFTYAWQSSPDGTTWSPVAGATASTFKPSQAEVGKLLRVLVSYTDGGGHAENATSAATGAVANVNDPPTGSVSIAGTVKQGQVLSVSQTLADPDGLGPLGLRWQSSSNGSSWTDIAGATGSTFTPGAAQVGLKLRVVASWVDGQGTSESVASEATANVAALNVAPTGSVSVGGTALQGAVLQATNTLADADGLGAITYRWQSSSNGSSWTDIASASGASLTLQQAQVGLLVRAVASYTDGKGTLESMASTPTAAVGNVNDAPTGALALPATVNQNQSVQVTSTLADADGLGPLSYRWQSSADGTAWTDIAGAAAATFRPAQAQVGLRLRVIGSYVDAQGGAESVTSNATAPVVDVNDAPGGSVGIGGGTPLQGRTLSATSALTDADGMGTVSWRWQVVTASGSGIDIAGATDSQFTPTEAEVGRALRVVATYTDGAGHVESVATAVPGLVGNVNDAPSGSVVIAGSARVGQVLSATAAITDADGLGTMRWEWQASDDGARWSAVSGASAASFTVGSAQLGQQLRVVARYTDGHGSAESMTSAATAAVPNVVNGTAGNDTLVGTALADELNGLAGDDRLSGGIGADRLVGGDGIDTAAYTRGRADYTVESHGLGVSARTGTEGSDSLDGIERIAFADGSLAFDLEGHAGTTARIIGAVFGAAAVANPLFVGIGLDLLDGGTGTEALMQLALEARLGTVRHADVVTLLYQNVLLAAPTPAELAFWVGTLETGRFRPAELALLAAELDENADHIGLVGLAETGLAFDPQ